MPEPLQRECKTPRIRPARLLFKPSPTLSVGHHPRPGRRGTFAAAGLWMLKRWALWLTIVVAMLNILSAAPGIAFAPNVVLRAAATVTVVGFAVIVLLVVLPNSRRAYT